MDNEESMIVEIVLGVVGGTLLIGGIGYFIYRKYFSRRRSGSERALNGRDDTPPSSHSDVKALIVTSYVPQTRQRTDRVMLVSTKFSAIYETEIKTFKEACVDAVLARLSGKPDDKKLDKDFESQIGSLRKKLLLKIHPDKVLQRAHEKNIELPDETETKALAGEKTKEVAKLLLRVLALPGELRRRRGKTTRETVMRELEESAEENDELARILRELDRDFKEIGQDLAEISAGQRNHEKMIVEAKARLDRLDKAVTVLRSEGLKQSDHKASEATLIIPEVATSFSQPVFSATLSHSERGNQALSPSKAKNRSQQSLNL